MAGSPPSGSPLATPVFVLGKHRSGTTWLANQLCQHSRIAGVQHPTHHGIHESAYFSRIDGRYGDLARQANYSEFVEVMAASDYFHLAGADRLFLYSLWPSTYADVFRAVMDRYAAGRGADFWVEKSPSHTPLVASIARDYPDARFVGIIRNVVDVVASSLARPRSPGSGHRWGRIVRTTGDWIRCKRALQAFARGSSRILLVRYEKLTLDLEGELREVCRFLGIDFKPKMVHEAFPPNSSFFEAGERAGALSRLEKHLVRGMASTLDHLPVSMWELPRSPQRKRGPLPSWFFKRLWEELPDARSDCSDCER